jgi:hypothetical protein
MPTFTDFDSSIGIFPTTQPFYAAHGVPTFPVDDAKKPMVRAYHRIGQHYSSQLARNPKFASVDGIGFVAGRTSQITIIDVDTSSDRELAKAINRHGPTPLIASTPSGGHHLYYRHNGERRQIRPWPGLPVDLLGSGLAILPPSIATKGNYQFIEGSIADLDRLPPIHYELQRTSSRVEVSTDRGTRNCDLFRHCMKAARHCDSLDDLLDVARTFNGQLIDPLNDEEVIKVATSAWRYEETGWNYLGEHGAFFATREVLQLITTDQDAFLLLGFLRANNKPDAVFPVANGLAEVLGWRRQRIASARARLLTAGYIVPVRRAFTGHAALFQWGKRRERKREEEGVS